MKKITLFIFSGSGNTKHVAELYRDNLSTKFSVEVKEIDRIARGLDSFEDDFDMAGFIYPIHALNAPKNVFSFIHKYLPEGKERKVFLVKSPGDPFFNGGSSTEMRKVLDLKGYEVFHESMIVMPSNIWIRFPDDFIKRLLIAAETKVKAATDEIAENSERVHENSLLMRISTFIFSRTEGCGSFFFGKDLRIKSRCTGCGLCVKECPVENIFIRKKKPEFGWKCIMCMRCVYICPVDAVSPFLLNFFKVKKWYDLQVLIAGKQNIQEKENCKESSFLKKYEKYLTDKNFF